MNSIDRRIVQMQFDNQGFQSRVQQTIDSMKKLNESLKMKNTSNSISNLDNDIKKVSSSGLYSLAQGVDNISSKFSAMGVIAATALSNITNSAINTGKSIANALAIEPITSGFSEYETKMGSIQTILTNTAHQGTTLKDVTATLNELNDYADKTIYNFAEMTKNIGTFTAAGVDLETSTAAIKGIANLAAASGSSSVQASTAMYQLSQALAAGKVSLMDWNSVQNAGMGGKLFQDALIRTSEVMGTGAEQAIKKYGSFRESLTQGAWLTTEVLTETLKQIAGAYTETDLIAQGYTKSQAQQILQLAENATNAATEVKTVSQLIDTMKESVGSGWAQSWEYIIGDKDESTKFLTDVYKGFENLIKPSTDARNAMLEFWNEAGGRDDVIKGLSNIAGGVLKGVKAISSAFKEIFPPMTGEKLVEISEGFKNLSEKFKMSDETAGKIKNTFKGLFSVFNLVKGVVGVLIKSFTPLTGVIGAIGKIFISVTSGIGTFLSKINEAANTHNVFGKMSSAIDAVYSKMGSGLDAIANGITSIFDKIGNLDFSWLFNIADTIAGGLGSIFGSIANVISKINFNAIFAIISTVLTGGVLKTVKSVVDGVKDAVGSVSDVTGDLTSITDNISDVLDSIKDSLQAYQDSLNASTLMKISIAIGILAASLVLLGTLDAEQIENSLTGISVLFMELIAGLAVLIKYVGGSKIANIIGFPATMIALAVAMTILAVAVKNLADLSWEEIGRGLVGVAGSMAILIAAVKLMDGSSRRIKKIATSMLILSVAIVVISKAVKNFSDMNPNSLIQGLLGVGVVLSELCVFMKLMGKAKMSISSAAGILVLSAALMMLSYAVGSFGNLKTDQLIKGLTGVAVALSEILIFSKLIGNPVGLVVASAGLITLSIALNIMSGAVSSMGAISWDGIARGLTVMAGSLAIIIATVKMMPKTSLVTTSVGLGMMAGSLTILATALNSFGSMSWEEIGRGIAALAGSLAILAGAMLLMAGGLSGAIACTVFAGAIAILAPQLILLSQMDLLGLGIALGALAGTFVIFGVAALALSPLIPVMIALAGSFALLSLSCLGLAASVALLGTGLTMIAAAGSAAGFALVEIIRQITYLLPTIGTKLGEFLVNLAKAIGEGIPAFTDAIGKALSGILNMLLEYLPLMEETLLQLITSLLEVLGRALPKFVDVGVKCVISIAEGILKNLEKLVEVAVKIVVKLCECLAQNVGKLIQAGIELAIAIINGVAQGLRDNDDLLIDAIFNLLEAVVEVLCNAVTRVIPEIFKVGQMIIQGLIDGIMAFIGGVVDTIVSVGKAMVDAICNFLGIHSPSTVFINIGKNVIQGLINGIKSLISSAVSSIKTTAKNIINGAKSLLSLSTFKQIGKTVVQGIINGIKSLVSSAISNIKTLGRNIINGAKSLLTLNTFRNIGRNVSQGIINGIKSLVSSAVGSVKSLGKSIISGAKSILNTNALLSAGKNLIQGLINGIKSKVSSGVNAIKNAGKSVIAAGKSVFGIHSPSTVFKSIGKNVILGFVNGIVNNVSNAKESVRTMGSKVINTMKDTISKISDVLDNDMDSNPTITPVLDLSKIKKGTKDLDGLISNSGGNIALSTSGATIMSGSINKLQNGVKFGNNDIVRAINDLKNTLNNNGNVNNYRIDGVTYDDGTNISKAVKTLVRAAKIERRV